MDAISFKGEPTFDDGRGRYPDQLAANVPRGFRASVRAAADRERISASEFVRRAIVDRLEGVEAREAQAHG